MPNSVNQKAVVFDLDETIGHFIQLGMFINLIENYIGKELTSPQQQKILHLYPEDIIRKFYRLELKITVLFLLN